MIPPRRSFSTRCSNRSGIALMIAIVVAGVAITIIVGLVRQVVERTRQAERRLWTLQAEVLADTVAAELRRAAASKSEFALSSWTPPLAGLSGPRAQVTITRGGDSASPRFHVEVRVPDDVDAPAIALRDLGE